MRNFIKDTAVVFSFLLFIGRIVGAPAGTEVGIIDGESAYVKVINAEGRFSFTTGGGEVIVTLPKYGIVREFVLPSSGVYIMDEINVLNGLNKSIEGLQEAAGVR